MDKDSKVYENFKKTEKYAEMHKMKINCTIRIMVFNPGRSRDFLPRFHFNNDELDVVEEIKLLGVIIRSDLSWQHNTDYIVTKANKKLWSLRRLKKLGARTTDLVDVYIKQVRSLLEFAAVVWHPSLRIEDRVRIERVQKSALCIILGENYHSYRAALKEVNLESLFSRRNRLSKKFAKKSLKNSKFSKWFKPNDRRTSTRLLKPRFCEVVFRTERFRKSPLSYLTSILNMQ